MRLNVMIEGQEGPTYADLRALAQRVESVGLDGLYRSDHYTSPSHPDERGSTDAWATLAGLAVETSRIRLGTLVSPATFRGPGQLAKMAATVSAMAGQHADGGARIVLGMGTGWMEIEHLRHGFPFEDLDTRFRRLEEHLEAVRGYWDPDGAPFSISGEFVSIEDGRSLPVPNPRPRIVVGGKGLRRTPLLAARFADELNNVFAGPQECSRQRAALDAACEEVGRDPSTVGYSLMTGGVVASTEAEFRARVARLVAWTDIGDSVDGFIERNRDHWVLGTPDRAAERLAALAEAGVEQVMFQHLLVDDLDMLDCLAEDIRPLLASGPPD